MKQRGHTLTNKVFFDTIHVIPVKDSLPEIKKRASEKMINLRYFEDDSVGVALDETVTKEDVDDLLWIFEANNVEEVVQSVNVSKSNIVNTEFKRTSHYMTHLVFNQHHSETRIVRYMKQLENKDVSLVHSMIPLVSIHFLLQPNVSIVYVYILTCTNVHMYIHIYICTYMKN